MLHGAAVTDVEYSIGDVRTLFEIVLLETRPHTDLPTTWVFCGVENAFPDLLVVGDDSFVVVAWLCSYRTD